MKSRDELRALTISESSMGSTELRQLTELNLPSLSALDLHFNSLGDSLAPLFDWSCAGQLCWLNIGLNHLGGGQGSDNTTAHIRELARQKSLANLRSLDLWANDLRPQHLRAFAKYATMTRLTQLSLSSNAIQDEGVIALLKGKFRCLRILDLPKTRISDEAVRAIAGSAKMASLKRLNIGHNSAIGKRGLIAIADSPHLAQLTHLNLAGTQFGEPAGKALAESDRLPSIRHLNIGSNKLKPETLKALQRRYPRAVVKKPYH